MVEVHRIDALRQKESAVRVDEPPDPLDLLDTEVAARPNSFGDDAAPARSGNGLRRLGPMIRTVHRDPNGLLRCPAKTLHLSDDADIHGTTMTQQEQKLASFCATLPSASEPRVPR